MDFFEILNTLLIGPIKLIFEFVFSLVNDRINNPGVSIVCLSLAINFLVLPLYMRADVMQKKARDKEKKLHNGIAHIKKTFSGDEKMMILQTYYRQNDYSPFSALQGSVSLLLQIPFFMAAVQVLSNIPALEGASIGPIADLSKPDGLLVIGGLTLNLLPILMTVINFISSAIFSKDYPIKTKIQLYGLAIFFLVFLYKYPSGLVFYWLLNNVFSFIKTLFYKLPNPKKVLKILASVVGLGLLVFTFAKVLELNRIKYTIFFIAVGIGLQIPLIWPVISKKFHLSEKTYTPNKSLFILGTLLLTVLMGVLIPSSVIASSPQEFVDVNAYYSPIWFIVSSVCLAGGMFLIWMRMFYWLANDTGKYIFERVMLVLCGVAIVNYMFFGTDFGTLTMSLTYEEMFKVTLKENLINIAVMALIAVLLYFIAKFKAVRYVLLTCTIAFGVMSATNIVKIQQSVNTLLQANLGDEGEPYFELSKDGKNVVVVMLDRAIGPYVPFIMEQEPELKKQFEGFTYYSNTVSFGGYTNYATPSLLGGYEYTPVELNKRDTESLMSKHNEAHMVMPMLFSKNGFSVTISDPIYLNYQWTSDLSFFDDYPGIRGMKTGGKFTNDEQILSKFQNNNRNFFCYSIMKSSPLFLQNVVYNKGDYNQAVVTNDADAFIKQTVYNKKQAYGYKPSFLENYNVLENLPEITTVKNGDEDTFLFFANDVTHEPMLLQLPDYTPQKNVDNTGFDLAETTVYKTADGKTLKMKTENQVQHYHANVAALKKMGEWLDYLRENDVYDNTRIIIVSDHGRNLSQIDELKLDSGEDLMSYMSLLLVKDFNSNEFKTSNEFMTIADVPLLATEGIIEKPVNPFTNKAMNNEEKFSHRQFVADITGTKYWKTSINNGNTFLPSKWLSVSDDATDKSNWKVHEEGVLKEHSAE